MNIELPGDWSADRIRAFFNSVANLTSSIQVSGWRFTFDGVIDEPLDVDGLIKSLIEVRPSDREIISTNENFLEIQDQLIAAGGGGAADVRKLQIENKQFKEMCYHGLAIAVVTHFWMKSEKSFISYNQDLESEDIKDRSYCYWGRIESFKEELHRERVLFISKLPRETHSILSREDGPTSSGIFMWNAKNYSGLQPAPWKLLKFVWRSRGRTASYSTEMAEAVWGDSEYEFHDYPVKNAVKKINAFFNRNCIPLEATDSKRYRSVSVRPSKES